MKKQIVLNKMQQNYILNLQRANLELKQKVESIEILRSSDTALPLIGNSFLTGGSLGMTPSTSHTSPHGYPLQVMQERSLPNVMHKEEAFYDKPMQVTFRHDENRAPNKPHIIPHDDEEFIMTKFQGK